MLPLHLFIGTFCSLLGLTHPFVVGGVGHASRRAATGGALGQQVGPRTTCQSTYQHGLPCEKLGTPFFCTRSSWALCGVRQGKESSGAVRGVPTPSSTSTEQPLVADKEPGGLFEGILAQAKHLLAVIEKDASTYSMMKFNEDFLFNTSTSLPPPLDADGSDGSAPH